jgi:transposase
VSERRGYYTDTTDEQWALIEPVLLAWKAAHPSVSGHSGGYNYRRIVDAIFYQNRSGCQWSLLPTDFPPASAVKYYFYKWRDDGTDAVIHDLLRAQVRERAGRTEDPTASILDTQSLHVSTNVPAVTTGKDANKKVAGRKHGIATDVLGLLIAVVVVAAGVHENAVGIKLLDKVAAQMPTVTKVWVDQGFKKTVVEHGAALGIEVEIVQRNAADVGFVVQPTRWRVEQTFGILTYYRRLVRDYESCTRSSESRVRWAITAVMGRRLTGVRTPSWHPLPVAA